MMDGFRKAASPDLTSCDREPIHLLGQVQAFGFLVAVSMDWRIAYVSANIADYLGVAPDAVLGEPLDRLLPDSAIHSIRGRLQVLAAHDGAERLFGCDLLGKDRRFDVCVHVSGTMIVIEAEPSSLDQAIHPGALVKSMIARIQRSATLQQLWTECVRQLRGVTAFDRVMLYRFDESGAGSVVAESARGGLEPYLGLHYPASDIPAQARRLYIRNQIRLIADVEKPPVPLLAESAYAGEALDLTQSVTRAVSNIHIEYLKNMGVAASMSVSIVIGGQLWGLFALHHHEARHLALEMRASIEIFAQMASFLIEARIQAERREAEELARERHDRFVGRIAAGTGSIESIADFANELRELIACDGIAVWSKGKSLASGRTLPEGEIPALARRLSERSSGGVFAAERLSDILPAIAGETRSVAGVLAVPISRSARDYLLFFRAERLDAVRWAGNPDGKEETFGTDGMRLSPRRSFAVFEETVRGTCQPWSEGDIKAGEALRVSILEILLRFNEESERQQALASQRQELLIAELNHRVRNILSLMRALVAQSRAGASSADQFADIIAGRIQALARAHDQITSDDFSVTSLRTIIQTEISAYIGPKASRVALNGPDIYVEAKAFSTLALVFHEMVTNSAKYGALSDSIGRIAVDWQIDDAGCCKITWVETGGPVVAPPKRRGFGSTIIERSIPHDLGGESQVRYRLAGLEADFCLPQSVFHLVEAPASLPRTNARQGEAMISEEGAMMLKGLNGLIVEDNMIISLDAEQVMLDNGMANVFIAANVSEARRIVASHALDVALLDVNLGTETSFALIPDLVAAGVPFLFVTGYGEQIVLPAEAGSVATIKKPFDSEQLIAALGAAAAQQKRVAGT